MPNKDGVKRLRDISDRIKQKVPSAIVVLGMKDPELEKIRLTCGILRETHPPKQKNQYCSEEGIEILREIVRGLRSPN